VSDFDRLAGELEGKLDSLAATSMEKLGDRVEPWMAETAAVWAQVAELNREAFVFGLRSFREDILPRTCPEFVAEAVRAVAVMGSVDLVLMGFRTGHATSWEAWFELVEDADGLDAAERRDLLMRGSDFFFRYSDRICELVADAYQREFERAVRSGEQRRYHAIRGLLEGDSTAVRLLDFDLDRHHLGVVAWGEDPVGAVQGLGARLERPLLTMQSLERTCWTWISGGIPLGESDYRAIRGFRPPAGTRLALGLEASGEAGFRATNRQALRARLLAPEPGAAVVRYEDVAVEALAGENQEDARAFVARELEGIDDDSPASQKIRETLLAYFAAEHNAASAAAALGIHQQTVANRLRAAEDRLGRPVGARRVELEMALRLRAALPAEPVEAGSPAAAIRRPYEPRHPVFGLSG
jgi:hypothetical protein